jgi:hypothetical protein
MCKSKERIIEGLKSLVQSDPVKAQIPLIGAGGKSYSAEQTLREIEEETDFGQKLVASWVTLSEKENQPPSYPTHQQIEQRAYDIWLKTGCPQGQDKEHWQQAEKELNGEALEGLLTR